jgi:hypothetical protein
MLDQSDASGILSYKFEKIRNYSAHLEQVFRDKAVLWGQRATALASRAVSAHACDYLMVVSDAIDQSHWRLPRDPDLKLVKSLANFKRPSCVVICVWVVGILCRFWILDEDQAHDSSTTIDVVARTLEEVYVILEKEGKPMPPNIIYWARPVPASMVTGPPQKYTFLQPNTLGNVGEGSGKFSNLSIWFYVRRVPCRTQVYRCGGAVIAIYCQCMRHTCNSGNHQSEPGQSAGLFERGVCICRVV